MAAKADPEVLKKTISELGKVIKKPALTEKLLGRPPFRYLHDILMEVIFLINAHRWENFLLFCSGSKDIRVF